MNAELLLRSRYVLSETMFVDMVIWRLVEPVAGSQHPFKYRLALVADGVCVLRYDNEAGKGDHRHRDEHEVDYRFVDLETLQTDFWGDVDLWRKAR